jgi:hypothetical protein
MTNEIILQFILTLFTFCIFSQGSKRKPSVGDPPLSSKRARGGTLPLKVLRDSLTEESWLTSELWGNPDELVVTTIDIMENRMNIAIKDLKKLLPGIFNYIPVI